MALKLKHILNATAVVKSYYNYIIEIVNVYNSPPFIEASHSAVLFQKHVLG